MCVLRAGIGVCVSAQKSRKLQIRNRCNLVGICLMVNARSGWKLVTFDCDLWPWELFLDFSFAMHISSTVGSFECLYLATSFLVWRYNFRISGSPSSFKVTGSVSRSQKRKSGRTQVCAPSVTGVVLMWHSYTHWCFDAVGWVIWPVKIVPEMTYKVSSGTLNLCSLTHSRTHTSIFQRIKWSDSLLSSDLTSNTSNIIVTSASLNRLFYLFSRCHGY